MVTSVNNMNDHNEPMQSVLYKGRLIHFKVKMFPGNENHLLSIAENYFRTKKTEETEIYV